jgi:pimeloyl-ACP methyl ester carboxylesterase
MASVRDLCARMPATRLVPIPQARHAPELDQPARTLRAIQDFLAQEGAPAPCR